MAEERKYALRLLLLAGVQISLFIILHDGLLLLIGSLMQTGRPGVGWGIFVQISAYTFACVAGLIALLAYIMKRNRLETNLAGVILFCALQIHQIQNRPNRTLLLMGCGAIALLVPYFILGRRSKFSGTLMDIG